MISGRSAQKTLIAADYSHLQFWNLVSGREAGALTLGEHRGNFMTLSADGQVLATTTLDGVLRMFRAPPPSFPWEGESSFEVLLRSAVERLAAAA